MIEGLKIDVPSAELKAHLQTRADHHKGRSEFYSDRANDLSKGIKDADLGDEVEAMGFSNSGRGDPRDSLRASAKQHAERAGFFQFLADHLIDEVYRITEADFIKLEFASRYL